MPRPVLAVLVDLDGTLVDRDAALRAWLGRNAGLGAVEIDELIVLDRSDQASLTRLAAELLHRRPSLAREPRALIDRIRGDLPGWIRPDPGVSRGLARLAEAGLALGLVSNGGPGQRRKLAAANIPVQGFASVLISAEFGQAKPSPAIFEAALAELAVRAVDTIMIGDSPVDDIEGASAVGIGTCWVAQGRRYPEGLRRPDATVVDFAAAVEWLMQTRQGKSKSRVSASRTSEE